ncbi:MAG TPA: hydantoinase B/oxoprolinase family protein [Solirubrobacteraceae bacterium]|nr:hydantoinase B/oxoprolinase family protein [Solirubrobacteraceae bacterium]
MTAVDAPRALRLRDLDDGQFEARYGTDRFTASVLASRFRYVIKHMGTQLMMNAFSPIIRDWYDFAATISGPPELGYPMPAVSDSVVVFSGTMSEAVRNTVEEYGPGKLKPGDVLLCNDPVRIGTHPNDLLLIRPVFLEGRLVGTINLQAHMFDIGGTVPGGFSPTKRSTYENGLVIPPMLMFEGDEPIRSTFSLIFDNARFGPIMLPDFLSIAAALRLGERFLLDAIERYGQDAYLGALTYATDVSAETLREAVSAIADGVYEGTDLIDCDGIDDSEQYLIKVKVTVVGSRIEVDLSGTSRQARTSINAGWLDARTAVAVALKFLVDPATPFSSGVYRDLDVVLPPGSIACALPPDGAIMMNFEIQEGIVNAIFRALARALGKGAIAGDLGSGMTHVASGVHADGTPWATIGSCGGENGPWGATRHADAENSLTIWLSNSFAPSVESVEADAPVVLLRKEYGTDTSGPGTNRGGAATVKDSLWLTDGEHYPGVLHVRTPSGTGVYGGGDGTAGGVWLWEGGDGAAADFIEVDDAAHRRGEAVAGVMDPDAHRLDPDGTYFYCGRRSVWTVPAGSVFRYQTAAGGGWGDPLDRDPQRVLRDVRDEYVSQAAAREIYGVVVAGDPVDDPEGLSIDLAATDALRQSRRVNNHESEV